jgi:polysaccharide pyruvyl transferase WcaK-like protein
MPRALLIGDFGQPDPVESALIETFVRSLPSQWSPVVASMDPAGTSRRHQIEAVQRLTARNVPQQVRAADAVIVAGGTPFRFPMSRARQRPVDGGRNLMALSATASALSKPVAALGLGTDSLPGRSSRTLARGLVRQADLLVLRDEESAETLTAAGARPPFRVGSDPTWTVLDGPVTSAVQTAPSATVVLERPARSWFDADFLATALQAVERGGLRVQLQPWLRTNAEGGDLALARHLAARLDDAVILDTPPDLVAARDSLVDSSVVVCMRYHALVAAASAGARFVAASSTPGPRGLAQRFDQPSIAHDATPERLAEAVFTAAAGRYPDPATVRSEIAGAEEGFRLMRLLLNGGAVEDAGEITGLPLRPTEWAQ